jgi:cytoskeletal protein RodZ
VSAFGEKLRKQREQRGISLDAISNTTKISPRMLRAIEDEHFDQLPGGVFNKGFVRAYARQVGLDEEETVSDYLAALRESQVQSQTILPNFRGRPESIAPEAVAPDRRVQTEDRRKEARRSQDREAGAAEAGPYRTAGVPSNGDRHSKNRTHEDRIHKDRPHEDLHEENVDGPAYSSPSFLNLSSNPSNPSALHPRSHGRPEQFAAPAREAAGSPPHRVPWEKLAVVLLVVIIILALWTFYRRGQSPAASQPEAASHAPVPAVPASAPGKPSATATAVATKQPATPTQNSSAETSPDADINPPVSKLRPHVAAVKPTPALMLLIRADQTCWVSISADGQPVATETLIAPAHTSVRAAREITVKAGNTAGISFQLNGKEIQVQGNPGEVRTFTFDATGMRTSTDAQPTNPSQ